MFRTTESVSILKFLYGIPQLYDYIMHKKIHRLSCSRSSFIIINNNRKTITNIPASLGQSIHFFFVFKDIFSRCLSIASLTISSGYDPLRLLIAEDDLFLGDIIKSVEVNKTNRESKIKLYAFYSNSFSL